MNPMEAEAEDRLWSLLSLGKNVATKLRFPNNVVPRAPVLTYVPHTHRLLQFDLDQMCHL